MEYADIDSDTIRAIIRALILIPEIHASVKRTEALTLEMAMPRKTQPDVMDIREAADFLGLTVNTVYSYVSRKEIPYAKRGGKKLYFSREELTAFIKEGRIPTKKAVERAAFRKSGEAMLRGQKGAEAV